MSEIEGKAAKGSGKRAGGGSEFQICVRSFFVPAWSSVVRKERLFRRGSHCNGSEATGRNVTDCFRRWIGFSEDDGSRVAGRRRYSAAEPRVVANALGTTRSTFACAKVDRLLRRRWQSSRRKAQISGGRAACRSQRVGTTRCTWRANASRRPLSAIRVIRAIRGSSDHPTSCAFVSIRG
jgi:hypothetical protein